MDSVTIELVSNASGELFPDKILSSFTNFLPEQVTLEGQWEVAISEISYPSMYQNRTEAYFNFFDEKFSISTSTYNLQPGLYTSITDIVEAMKTLFQERNNHNETCITVKVSRRSQKVVIILANDTSGLAFCSTDLGHNFDNNVGNQFGVLMKGEGPHEPQFAYDFCSYPFVDDLQRSSRVQHCWRHKSSLATMLSLYLKAKGSRHYNNCTVHELSDIQ